MLWGWPHIRHGKNRSETTEWKNEIVTPARKLLRFTGRNLEHRHTDVFAMNKPPELETDRWGIDNGYLDTQREWHPTPRRTRGAILKDMGVGDPDAAADDEAAVRVVERGNSIPCASPANYVLKTARCSRSTALCRPTCRWAITSSALPAVRRKPG